MRETRGIKAGDIARHQPHGEATFQEIHGQIASCEETVRRAAGRLEAIRAFLPFEQYTDIVITGCGSSFNLAQCGAFAWSEMLGRSVYSVPASELMHFSRRYLRPGSKPLLLAISRTGATTEVTIAAQEMSRRYSARSIALTLCPASDIGSVCDMEIAFPECHEESVVMTRAFASILTAVYLLGDGVTGGRYYDRLVKIPELIGAGIRANEGFIRSLATIDGGTGVERFVFLGSGPLKGLADESALKVTEMALLPAVSYHLLEFRHGPIAALDERGVVVVFPGDAELQYVPSLLRDIRETGARAYLVLMAEPRKTIGRISGFGNCWVTGSASAIPEVFRPAIFAYAGQLIGYWKASARDVDPDHPRNLQRTVFLKS